MTANGWVAVAITLLAAWSVPAHAERVRVVNCIDLQKTPAGGVVMHNQCSEKLLVSYCVENDDNFFKCSNVWSSGRVIGGAKTLAGGRAESIPDFYKAPGRVRWGACIYPGIPALRRDGSFACDTTNPKVQDVTTTERQKDDGQLARERQEAEWRADERRMIAAERAEQRRRIEAEREDELEESERAQRDEDELNGFVQLLGAAAALKSANKASKQRNKSAPPSTSSPTAPAYRGRTCAQDPYADGCDVTRD